MSKEARDVHLHVLGLSRQGKSYLLEHLIRQDIKNGAGVCVIDPHGELYGNLVDWLAANDMHRSRRIHLINPAAGEWSVGFNPLCRDDPYVSARVGAMIAACQKVWGDEESTGHKTLAKLLDLVFSTLAAKRLSLREAVLLTTLQHRSARQRLVAEIGDHTLTDDWAELDHLRNHDFVQRFESVHNRLRELTRTPGISSMIGQTEHVIDFRQCMEGGHVVLVNLAHRGRVKPDVAQTIGALVTADLFHSAQTRDIATAKHQPFYCYIDECGDYLNETIVKGLDQTAKFGLHYILAHQRLSQLGTSRDDPIRNGVMGGAQSKIVFLEDDLDTARELGELLFGKSFDLERPKQVLIKPTVVGYSREWLVGEGIAEGSFSAVGSSSGSGLGLGMSLGEAEHAMPVHIETSSNSEAQSESFGQSFVRQSSKHEALVPILEDLPTGTYSIEELRHLATVQVRLLQKRQAYAYRADDRQAVQFVTADVSPMYPTPTQTDAFFSAVRNREPTANRTSDVEAAVLARRQQLLATGSLPDATGDDFLSD